MWRYEQKSGEWSGDEDVLGFGYSGRMPDGKNNPGMQSVENVGPIPCGLYTIGPPRDDAKLGEFVLDLVPDPENVMFGRSEFRIHGDSVLQPGWASHGCIILSRINRERIWQSGDHRLQVVSGE